MKAVDEHLFRRANALIQLLDSPFDKSNLHPGHGSINIAVLQTRTGDGEQAR
jgi:hypothetical protein